MALKNEFEGKDVEEAINNACAALNTSRELLNIEILSTGSVGIFGLCRKMARVHVSKKEQREAAEKIERKRKPRVSETAAQAPSQKPPVKKVADEHEDEEGQPVAAEQEAAPVLTPEVLAAIAADVAELLRLMGMSAQITVTQEGGKVKAHIEGDDLDSVIGHEGQTLDGLQYLMRKMVAKKFPEKISFVIDAGDFRTSRKSELESLALQLAQEVKDTGKTKSIPPINPAERRIVHMVLQNDTTIRSRSVGEGLFKKILIYLPGKGGKKKPSPPRRKNNRDKQESA